MLERRDFLGNMKFNFTESVLPYNPLLYDAWKEGQRDFLPQDYCMPDEVKNQPSMHFGEHYVWVHYLKLGWHGFVWYAIGEWEPNNAKYDIGRQKVNELFNDGVLQEIRNLRKGILSGEPDLFFFKDDGSTLFIEVKKGRDKPSDAQLTCLAQIKSILGADVGITYLVPEGKEYVPKVYELDLVNFNGRVI
jgi:hypothetical protein